MKRQEFHFHPSSSRDDVAFKELSDFFLDPRHESISAAQIKQVAENISQRINGLEKDSEQADIILSVLTYKEVFSALCASKEYSIGYKEDPWPIYCDDTDLFINQSKQRRQKNQEYIDKGIYTITHKDAQGEEQVMDISIDELDDYLRPIRKAVLEELKVLNPDLDIHLIDRSLTTRVVRLHGEKIVKFAFDRVFSEVHVDKTVKENRNTALRILYSQKERSPYLAYQMIASDFDTEPYGGVEMQRELPIITLDAFLKQEGVLAKDAVNYILDAIRGAAFLVDHGLRITDLAPENIGINLETGKGQLFDDDALFTDDFIFEGYMAHAGYCPPERLPDENSDDKFEDSIYRYFPEPREQKQGVVQESEMVYEFGMTLRHVYKHFQISFPEIINQMTSEEPGKRPSLKQAIEALQ
ncbi:MAG: hypothetical protein ACD_66C00013G0001 [uncultured bacterium]|uniref:Protein kinase domain-containing protein n=1 Tax=Candidatus Uhrbacteria bacterium GW2011_GWC1_41_20 TaxID=1618983 RepID=A0A0G0VE30_9BACT|nr:MAG: hypothetical protein ACD_66C00013G0001 [uncultured bacterium]KKR22228.1 MAG: hypothetical protein UT52_C0019G0013 [Candidatus Uhrbacteria bacterium GW2011_GWE1_39_46]KKR63428.1 MAG: hypothetical protein UU04_C0018G0013 [Candidatus Uhrbacteria bacterium GW2011_GWC2_40_450]KKR89662.1 MAG: hypothetical protein UU40_C0018G0013 [Candidatus Uhrbacteria bacterium GW2011_GWD2_41_121]KKR95404.1 MAG: hypothetical protein UU46_C0023G0013 [Candidatus Uhrbacteria bacterium GW2011_GWD1_41_16]KKR9793